MVDEKGTRGVDESFGKHPQIRGKVTLYYGVFLVAGLIGQIGLFSFVVDPSLFDFFVQTMAVMTLILVAATIWISVSVRCPRCKSRVLTPASMWKNKMPLGRNRHCPTCGFPNNDARTQIEES
jgi:hypothetical protein